MPMPCQNKSIERAWLEMSWPFQSFEAERFGPFPRKGCQENFSLFEPPGLLQNSSFMHAHTPHLSQYSKETWKVYIRKVTRSFAAEVDEQVLEKILTHRKGRSFSEFATQMRENLLHGNIWKPSNSFVDKHGSNLKIGLKFLRSQDIFLNTNDEGRNRGGWNLLQTPKDWQ